MTATLTTFGPMLKEFYQGPVAEQINNRVWAREYFEKRTKGWSGRRMVIPVHTGRNTGVGFRGETALLPDAGRQQYEDLIIHSRNSYGRFQVTGEAMDTALKGGVGAFAGVMEEEMNRLVRDIANMENHACIFGGAVKGFLNQRRAGNVSVGAQTPAGAPATGFSAAQAWEYQGDFSYFNGDSTGVATQTGLTPADVATWVRVRLFRMDTYAELTTGGANTNFMVGGFVDNRTNPTITLYVGDDAGGASLDTSALPGDCSVAVVISDTQAVSAATPLFGQNPTNAGTWTQLVADTPDGIFTNLASAAHFTVDRTTATGSAVLQSTIVTHDPTGNGDRANAASDLSLERIQYMFDTLLQDAGVDPDLMIMNALMRHRYTVQLTGVLGATGGTASNVVVEGSSGKVMDNQQNLAYGGVKFQYDRHFPICSIGFITSEPWLFAELASGQFADDDGNVLARAGIGGQGVDQYEGYWKHRYNLVCRRPNSQALLVGISPT